MFYQYQEAYLLVCTILLLILPSQPIFLLSSVVGAAISIWCYYDVIRSPWRQRFAQIFGGTLLLAYAGGALISGNVPISSSEFLQQAASGFPISSVCAGLATVFFATASLLLYGRLEHRQFKISLTHELMRIERYSFILLGLFIVGAYETGDIGYMGVKVSSSNHITLLGALASSALLPALGMAGHLIGLARRVRGRGKLLPSKYVVVLLAGVLFIIAAATGRRNMMASALIFAYGYALAGGFTQFKCWRSAMWGGALLTMIFVGTVYFTALRLAGYAIGPSASFGDRIRYAAEVIAIPAERSQLFTSYTNTLTGSRPFVLGYVTSLITQQSVAEYSYGSDALRALAISMPSFIYAGKHRLLDTGSEEALINPKFKIPVMDDANSIITAGLGDFGTVGAVVYPILIIMLLDIFFIFSIAHGPVPDVARLFFLLSIVAMLLQPEEDISFYFSNLRDAIIWVGLLTALVSIVRMLMPAPAFPGERKRLFSRITRSC